MGGNERASGHAGMGYNAFLAGEDAEDRGTGENALETTLDRQKAHLADRCALVN
jgi:hypothetical protein